MKRARPTRLTILTRGLQKSYRRQVKAATAGVNRMTTQAKRAVQAVGQEFVAVVHYLEHATLAALRAVALRVIGVARSLYRTVTGVISAVGQAVSGFFQRISNGVLGAVAAAGRAVSAFCGGIYRGLTGALATLVQGVADLFRQIGSDIRSVVRGVIGAFATMFQAIHEAVMTLFRTIGKVLLAPLHPIIKPARALFARRAKEELYGAPSLTPDRHSPRELLLLLGAVGVLVGGLAYWLTAAGAASPVSTGQVTQLLSHFTPAQIISRLASYSPAKLMVVMSGFALGLAGFWFWLKMLHDSFARSFDSNTERTKWRTTVVVFGLPGAAVYFWKIYNHWSLKQFAAHHFLSVMVTGVAVVVASSTYGTLWYFNKKAEAQTAQVAQAKLPSLQIDERTKQSLLGRSQYGAPLTPNSGGGRTDPFAPIPGQAAAVAAPSPSPSPTPTPPATIPDNQ